MNRVDTLAETFKALSDPIRLTIVQLLARQSLRKDICVGDLARELGTSQPNVSHHLKVLKSSRLIKCEKRDHFAFYILDRKRFGELAEELNSKLTDKNPEPKD